MRRHLRVLLANPLYQVSKTMEAALSAALPSEVRKTPPLRCLVYKNPEEVDTDVYEEYSAPTCLFSSFCSSCRSRVG